MENKGSEFARDNQHVPSYLRPNMEQPQSMVNYRPNEGRYPPEQGRYPPQHGRHPSQHGRHPSQQGHYPPEQGRHAPEQGRHPPEQGHYPPQHGHHPPQQGGYSPQPAYPAPLHTTSTNTTVVIQQPQAQVVVQGPRPWSTGLCSCLDDCGVCLLGCFCPCILECMVSTAAGECCCVARMCPIALRTKIRTRHNIQGSIVDDSYAFACCGVCVLCQMQRELKLHGI